MVYQVIANVKIFKSYQNLNFMFYLGRNTLLWSIKKVGNLKLENFAILVCKINLVKNQEFIGQLGENQLINILPK